VTGPSREADADIITAGREPRHHHARPGRLVRLLVIAQAAALIGVIAVAAVYASPGLRGRFTQGSAEPFPADQAPCAPSP
jgi:hypothetical protein